MRKGKRSEEEVSARKLMVLERVFGDKDGVSISELAKEYKVGEGTIKKYVEALKNKIPIIEIKSGKVHSAPTGLEAIWSGTVIGKRLAKPRSKIKLAEAAISFVKKNKKKIQGLVLGTGTTVHECARELINKENDLEHMRVYTDNLLVLHDFIYYKPDKLYLEMPHGELDMERAALRGDEIADYLRNLDINVVITSFSDMSFDKGFCTVYQDKAEKFANLCPKSKNCRWVIVPIEWLKIGRKIGNPVAESRDEQLDFANGRKYIIITDRPSETDWDADVDNPKREDLEKWLQAYPDGIEIIYA
jgi:DeoR/GlpR family transcriptional regulator of sugar metabolism